MSEPTKQKKQKLSRLNLLTIVLGLVPTVTAVVNEHGEGATGEEKKGAVLHALSGLLKVAFPIAAGAVAANNPRYADLINGVVALQNGSGTMPEPGGVTAPALTVVSDTAPAAIAGTGVGG